MHVTLAYGQHGLPIEVPASACVLEPAFCPGLPDEAAALAESLRRPIGTPPLAELLQGRESIAIVINDITRPVPSDRILPPLLAELRHVPRERITILNALGLHRPNTPEELARMVGREVYAAFADRIVNHNAFDPAVLQDLGTTRRGTPVQINRTYLQADLKILTGFIEPHFFAGFSGGRKVLAPGLAGAATVVANHGAQQIDHESATYGVLEGNPIHADLLECAQKAGVDFIVNVALNKQHAITGVWSGELEAAHAVGVEFVRRTAMVPVAEPFDIVVTTNSGYPLDLNLYQTVKGMSAAARVLRRGGLMLVAAECRDGIGEAFHELLTRRPSPEALLEMIHAPGWSAPEQWQVQILAQLLTRHEIHLYAPKLDPALIRACHLQPVDDLQAFLNARMAAQPAATLALLPQGPMTIPYLEANR